MFLDWFSAGLGLESWAGLGLVVGWSWAGLGLVVGWSWTWVLCCAGKGIVKLPRLLIFQVSEQKQKHWTTARLLFI